MAYEKPIELQVSTQNISGTEAQSVEALTKIERLLNKTLAAGDIFKSPAASINYKTHEVTKSFFVRKDAEKIVRDTLKAHEELFINPLTIASKEAKTRKYKVDVEGDRALASLRANTASLGGRTYGNQHGTYIEVPSYKGSLASARNDAVKITQTMRTKQEEEREKEEQKAQKAREKEAIKIKKEKEREEIRKQKEDKEREREEIRRQKEAERKAKQKERDKEREEQKAATDSRHRGIAIIAGISSSILLLRKLISLVENIVTGILKASDAAFTTTMDADRLGIDPVILRNMKYAGLAKGIGEAPINALKATNSLFGSQLLAAANVDKIKPLAPMLGGDVVDLINKGEGGKSPFKMTAAIIDAAFNNYINGLNELNQKTGNKAANKRSIANTLAQASEDYATNFIRMVQDYEAGKKVEGFQQWIYDAMPISSPSSANLAAASENKKEYDEAVSELKSVINLIATTLSPLLNPLSEAIQKLSGFLMRIFGDNGGVSDVSRKNYDKMLEAKARDEAEVKNLTAIENEYLAANKDLFPTKKSFTNAINDLHLGKVPSAIADDPKRIQEFFDAFGVRALIDLYTQNLNSYEKNEADFSKNSEKYASGEKTFTFSDKSPAELLSSAEKLIANVITKAYKQSKGIVTTSQSYGSTLEVAARLAVAKQVREETVEKRAIDELTKGVKSKNDRIDSESYKKNYYDTKIPQKIKDAKLKELYAAYDAEVAGKPMQPVTSGTGFGWDDAEATKEAIATTLNMLSGNLIVQALKAEGQIQKSTEYVEISKREDGDLNINVNYVDTEGKKKNKSFTRPISEGYGITENVTIYLAE